jgi:hypothetical protein
LVIPSEPVINLSPFPLVYNDHQQISLICGGMDGWSFGVDMSYPKVVSYSSEKHQFLYDTTGYVNYNLYIALRKSISDITVGLKIQSPSKLHRVGVHISKSAKSLIDNNRALIEQHLQIV